MHLCLVVLGRNMRILVLLASVNLFYTVLLQDVEVVNRTTQFQLGPYYFITTLAGHEVRTGLATMYLISYGATSGGQRRARAIHGVPI